MRTLFVTVLSLLISFGTFAIDLELGEPSYGGSGCPQGTASVTLGPDRTAISILFDDYIVEAGAINNRRYTRKTCGLAIPVHVPQGYSVSILKTDYRGFAEIPYGGYGRFTAEYFFAGSRGPRLRKRFYGGYTGDYLFRTTVAVDKEIWSPCGKDVILRTNTSMYIKTNRDYDDTMATVDSIDIESGIVYHVRWRSCI